MQHGMREHAASPHYSQSRPHLCALQLVPQAFDAPSSARRCQPLLSNRLVPHAPRSRRYHGGRQSIVEAGHLPFPCLPLASAALAMLDAPPLAAPAGLYAPHSTEPWQSLLLPLQTRKLPVTRSLASPDPDADTKSPRQVWQLPSMPCTFAAASSFAACSCCMAFAASCSVAARFSCARAAFSCRRSTRTSVDSAFPAADAGLLAAFGAWWALVARLSAAAILSRSSALASATSTLACSMLHRDRACPGTVLDSVEHAASSRYCNSTLPNSCRSSSTVADLASSNGWLLVRCSSACCHMIRS